MHPNVHYARTEAGNDVAFCAIGEGPPLIAVPSGPWDTIQNAWRVPAWQEWLARLASQRSLVRYDMPGTGLSGSSEDGFSLESQMQALDTVLGRLNTASVALLASQHAGPVAIAYAARRPERVSRLVLWCTYARGADYLGSSQSQAIHGLLHHDWATFMETITHSHVGWSEGDLAHQLASVLGETVTHEMVAAFDAVASRVDVTALLSRVGAPTQVLHRSGVRHPDLAISRDLAASIPNAELVVLEGESATPFVGNGDAVLQAIDLFLDPAGRPQRRSGRPGIGARLVEPLSPREMEVLVLIARGLSNEEIARELVIAPGTSKTHTASILRKLGVNNRTRAVARARELRLLDHVHLLG